MVVRPGYKQTEVGLIPEEWDCALIRDAAANRANAIVGGPFGSDLVSADYAVAGVPVVRGQNMSASLVSGDFVFVSPRKAKSLSANLTYPGDLVFTQRGTLGQVSIVPGNGFECYLISQSQMKVSLNRTRHDPSFVHQYFASRAGQKQITASAIQTGVPHTNLGILRAYRFPAPPLPEQRAIAAALSDVDALLGGVDRLITKKRDLKQAAMQQLLTGRTRLQGFKGDWKTRCVAEMGDVLAGKALNVNGGGRFRPYLRTKNVLDGRIDLADVLEMPMSDAEFERFRVLHGDVLLNEGQSIGLVGRCSLYRDELPSPCAMQNQLLRFRAWVHTSSSYAEHLFRYCQHTGIFAAIATQTTSVAHLGSLRFSKLELLWPLNRDEQDTIAAVLSDMDAELSALEARRDKTRALKQAMMQELLTGRTRLVVPNEVDAHA